jgi:hypothetical protein
MSAVVARGAALRARINPGVSPLGRRILNRLAGDNPPRTLDQLAAPFGAGSRPWVFAEVARLEDHGWLQRGVIR